MRFHALVLSIFLTSSFSLATAHAGIAGLDALGIPHKATKQAFATRGEKEMTDHRHATDNHTLQVEVGPLTPEQHKALSASLAGSALAPAYRPGGVYRLEEFLPPAVQALHGKQFRPIEEVYAWPTVENEEGSKELEDIENFALMETPLGTLINCWTTAYEVLRTWKTGAAELDITWMSRTRATEFFTEEQMGRLKPKATLAFGDALVFTAYDEGASQKLVQHVAIFVTSGLYFEKTDSSQDDAFRFISEKDIMAKYRKIFGKKLQFGHYRLKPGATFPRLSETLNLYSQKDFYGKYFSDQDLKTIAFEFDWVPSLAGISKPKTEPLRLHSIGIVKESGGYFLDRNAKIYPHFQEPLRKP